MEKSRYQGKKRFLSVLGIFVGFVNFRPRIS